MDKETTLTQQTGVLSAVDNAMPEENAPTPSRAPQLIDHCRRALRSRSVDRAHLKSLLTGLTHEHAALVARFDRQRPRWNVVGSRDRLRTAAEATLRICLKTLQLRLNLLERDDLNNLSPGLFAQTLRALAATASELKFSVLKEDWLRKEPPELSVSERKTLMFERATHSLQVEGYCCFLHDLKRFRPISEPFLTDWLSEIRSANILGNSTRRNTIHAATLLIQLSCLPAGLLENADASADRAQISSLLFSRDDSQWERVPGQWEWFTADAQQACLNKLHNAGLLNDHDEVHDRSPAAPGAVAMLAADSTGHSVEINRVRDLYDELSVLARGPADQQALQLKLRDVPDAKPIRHRSSAKSR